MQCRNKENGKRTQIVLSAVALFCAATFASPSFADWKYTKWGMSLDEVIRAGEGSVTRLSGDQSKAASTFVGIACRAQALAPVSMGGITFSTVNFCFDANGKLASVDLYCAGDQFYAVDRALASAFGAPVRSDDGMFPERIYNDKTKGNSLRLIHVSSTILSYSPIPSGF